MNEDPAWWADLASQLPAAWGTGAFDSARWVLSPRIGSDVRWWRYDDDDDDDDDDKTTWATIMMFIGGLGIDLSTWGQD